MPFAAAGGPGGGYIGWIYRNDTYPGDSAQAGYGPTIRADAVKKLVDSVIGFQERSQQIIEEMRKAATQNSAEIRDAVEDGKRRIAKLVADGKALPV